MGPIDAPKHPVLSPETIVPSACVRIGDDRSDVTEDGMSAEDLERFLPAQAWQAPAHRKRPPGSGRAPKRSRSLSRHQEIPEVAS